MSSNPRVPLSYHVFVAPEKPFNGPAPRVGDSPAWDPTTSTLILGARDAVLVDALATVREATALADWVALHDRRLTTIYVTHGHGDHYLGLSVLLDRFPEARAVATAGTVEQMRKQTTPAALHNGFRTRFPGQIADTVALAEPIGRRSSNSKGSLSSYSRPVAAQALEIGASPQESACADGERSRSPDLFSRPDRLNGPGPERSSGGQRKGQKRQEH